MDIFISHQVKYLRADVRWRSLLILTIIYSLFLMKSHERVVKNCIPMWYCVGTSILLSDIKYVLFSFIIHIAIGNNFVVSGAPTLAKALCLLENLMFAYKMGKPLLVIN